VDAFMGVALTLRIIDSHRLFVVGSKVVQDATDQNDPELLRRYLRSLPASVDLVATRQRFKRLRKLRELRAPEIILENEERMLREARRKQFTPESLTNASMDELRKLLNELCSWCHDFGDNNHARHLRRTVNPHNDDYRYLGRESRAVLAALDGIEEHPLFRGTTFQLGSFGHVRYGDFGYNPPEAVREIDDALAGIELDDFVRHMPKSQELAEKLDRARQDFALLRRVYWFARRRGAGVGSECM